MAFSSASAKIGLDNHYNALYVSNMRIEKQEPTTMKIWVKTRRKLRIIAALSDESIVETVERLAAQELARIQEKAK